MNNLLLLFLIINLYSFNVSAFEKKSLGLPTEQPTVLYDKNDADKLTFKKIYYDKKKDFLTTEFFDGLDTFSLPIVNNFQGTDFCYLSCIGNEDKSVINSKSYGNIIGLLRVKGEYENDICWPYGVHQNDYSNNDYLIELCQTFLEGCKNEECKVDGKTTIFLDNEEK